MNKTLEQLVKEHKGLFHKINETEQSIEVISKYDVVNLLKQVREATLIEATNAVYTKTESIYTGGLNGNGLLYEDVIVIDKDLILNLDKNSIEL